MESLSFLYRSQAGASPLICSGMLTCCCSSVGQARRNQYACYTCCPESCENPSIDRSMPGPPAWDSCRHRTFNSEAGQRFRNYCAGFCSRHCEWAWMTLHRSELRVGFC
jgi:hypothetical protein